MKRIVSIMVASICIAAGAAFSDDDTADRIREFLNGLKEAPAVVSTTGNGTFRGQISGDDARIDYTLSFAELEGDVTQAHIHIGHEQNAGGIVLWLCETAANPNPNLSAPTPACFNAEDPLASRRTNTVSGTLTAADIVPQAANGIAAGEFAEVLNLIRAGRTYVNVHSAKFGPGEIRSQIDHGGRGTGH